MKSSWTYFATRSALWLLVLLMVAMPAVGKKKQRKHKAAEDLINVFLSPEHSQWLIGPVAGIATDEEIAAYLGLMSDAEAERFVEEFWDRRGGDTPWPAKGPSQIFRERAEEADKLYREQAYQGHHTDRGTIYVLYGPPDEIRYELAAGPRRLSIETWEYSKDAEPGLDGEVPKRVYRFVQDDDLMVFYLGSVPRRPPR